MTSTAVERRPAPAAVPAAPQRGGALSLAHMTPREAWLFCESLANTPLLPDPYRKNPASVLWAMEYGRALGLDVVTTITTIHVIKGKPTQSADLMLSRAREAGHRVRIKAERTSCVVRIVRHDDPDDETVVEWTLEDAVTACLCELRNGRPYARDDKNRPTSWEKYPRAMLRSRAIAEAVRIACPEVLHGAIYTPEELGAVVDQEGNAVEVPAGTPVPETIPHTEQPRPARDYLAEAVATADADQLAALSSDATAAGAPEHYLAQLEAIRAVHAAPDAAAAGTIWKAAKTAGAPDLYLDQLAAIGATKPGAKQPRQQGEQQPDGTAPTGEQAPEHTAELTAMYDAATAAGLNRAEADDAFTAAHQCKPSEAAVEQLRSQRDDLLEAVQGAAA